jgi:hypothetical protein
MCNNCENVNYLAVGFNNGKLMFFDSNLQQCIEERFLCKNLTGISCLKFDILRKYLIVSFFCGKLLIFTNENPVQKSYNSSPHGIFSYLISTFENSVSSQVFFFHSNFLFYILSLSTHVCVLVVIINS